MQHITSFMDLLMSVSVGFIKGSVSPKRQNIKVIIGSLEYKYTIWSDPGTKNQEGRKFDSNL